MDACRVCRLCKKAKPVSDFGVKKHRKDGLNPDCKPCNTRAAQDYAARGGAAFKARKQEYDKKRNAAMVEALRDYHARTYPARRQAKIAYATAYWKAHPDKARATKRAYRHRRRSLERQGVTGPELSAWCEAQVKQCYWCGSKCADSYHIDHYEPLSKGGKHELANLRIACPPCNYRKHAKDPLDFAREVGRLF